MSTLQHNWAIRVTLNVFMLNVSVPSDFMLECQCAKCHSAHWHCNTVIQH